MDLTETFWQDARGGMRALAKNRGFTVVAALTLALGVGANTAIFSVINGVLLTPLPYSRPETRVMIWSRWTGWNKTWLSEAEVLDYRKRCTTLRDVAAWASGQVNLTGDGEPIRVGAARVTANTFTALGVEPLLGRTFAPEEDVPGHDKLAVLSFGLWQRRYGGDPGIVGKSISVNGEPRTIVGIMPPGFQLPTDFNVDVAEPTQLWVPLAMDLTNISRGGHGLYGAARLAPGATAESATAELQAVTKNLTREGHYPEAMQFSAFAVPVTEEILGEIRPAILLLFGAVGFLLLIACLNVANLLLARAEVRQREMAVRSALGAGPGRLFRQLLTESLVLSLLGGAVGLALAYAGVRLLVAANPTSVPRVATVALDTRVLVFTAVLALVTSVLFSLAPAIRALGVDLTESLKDGTQHSTIGGRRQRLRGLLVIVEMALAVVLMIGAGLMIRSLWALRQIDLGFDPNNALTLRLSLPETSYRQPEAVVGFYRQLLERIRALPGVRHAGIVRSLPLAATIGDSGLDVEGFVEIPGHNAKGDWQVVSDGAFQALGERLIRGRVFTPADRSDSMLVAVVNETMAKMYWADGNPIGKRIRMASNIERPWATVVGIVGNVRHNGVDAIVKEKFYVPHSQFHLSVGSPVRGMTLVVKTALDDPLQLVGPIKNEIRALDPNLPIADIRTMRDVVRSAISTERFTGFLMSLFAALALALSAVGIYGVLSYLVSRRTHEIGIRLAIGASRGHVLRMVLQQGFALSVAGVVIGVFIAFNMTRLMPSLLHGVQPTDAMTFITVPVVLSLVALVASFVPALRATRVDPLIALRAE